MTMRPAIALNPTEKLSPVSSISLPLALFKGLPECEVTRYFFHFFALVTPARYLKTGEMPGC